MNFTDKFADLEELKNIFLQLDTSHDGKLSIEEVRDGLQQAMGSFQAGFEWYQQILVALDKDCNDYIDYTEFLTAAVNKTKLLTQTNLKTAFEMFDTDKSGKVTLDELKRVFDMGGIKDSQMWVDIMAEVDQDGDNAISYEEFAAQMEDILSKDQGYDNLLQKRVK